MAMVVAQRGQRFIKVSRHAYDTLFKNKGYRIVQDDDEPKKVMTETEEFVEEEQDDDEPKKVMNETEGFVEEEQEEEKEKEIDSIPISEMNKEQLAEYAKEHNIDTSAARNVREARQIIQKAIRESKM